MAGRERSPLDPRSVYGTPEALLSDDGRSREEKLLLLERWRYDAAELSVAEEEGMAGDESDLLARVQRAIRVLGGTPGAGGGPTKHGS